MKRQTGTTLRHLMATDASVKALKHTADYWVSQSGRAKLAARIARKKGFMCQAVAHERNQHMFEYYAKLVKESDNEHRNY